MDDDISLGLSSLAICFDFHSTNVVQLSNQNPYLYRFRCHQPLIIQLNDTLSSTPGTLSKPLKPPDTPAVVWKADGESIFCPSAK